MSYYQKYRPRRFRGLVGQQDIADLLRGQVRRHKLGHAYLFAGPSGVGKTSTARILAMAVNCEQPRAGEPCLKCPHCLAALHGSSWDTIEMDAATFRGIDGIRDLQVRSMFTPLGNFKVYILDEVQQFTQPAWDALLRLLEEPAAQQLTIMCTTRPDQVPETAKSRCQVLQFAAIEQPAIAVKLDEICRRERIHGNGAVKFIASMAGGNLRTAETMLEQTMSFGFDQGPRKVKKFIQEKLVLS